MKNGKASVDTGEGVLDTVLRAWAEETVSHNIRADISLQLSVDIRVYYIFLEQPVDIRVYISLEQPVDSRVYICLVLLASTAGRPSLLRSTPVIPHLHCSTSPSSKTNFLPFTPPHHN